MNYGLTNNVSQLTDEQRTNLEKLATYLENLPVNYEMFHMGLFFCTDEPYNLHEQLLDYTRTGKLEHSCGTVACALGHGPAAGIAPKPENTDTMLGYADQTFVNWSRYTEQFCPECTDIEEYLFSGAWSDFDDTHRGAAARIRYLLAGNDVPSILEADDEEEEQEIVAQYQPFVIQGDDHIKAA